MKCTEVRRLLGAFHDGSLPEPGRIDISRHVESCGVCRGQFESRDRMVALLRRGLRVPEPGDLHLERERARILKAAGIEKAPQRRATWLLLTGAIAASIVIVILTPGKIGLLRTPSDVQAEPVARPPFLPPAARTESAPASAQAPPAPPLPGLEPVAQTDLPAGTADRVVRMTKEAVEVALAETPAERVTALCAAAEAQLRELSGVIGKDPLLAGELAQAYRVLLAEGVTGVLRDKSESEPELAIARDLAKRRTKGHEETLAALVQGAGGTLKDNLSEALAASRSLSER